MFKMFRAIFVFSLIAVVSILVIRDVIAFPQIGAQFGEIHNNGTGGGNLYNSNGSSTVPGSGYPGHYSHHSNETAPTSPSASGGSFDMQNSTWATSTCDCSQMTNPQEAASTKNPSGDSGSASGSEK